MALIFIQFGLKRGDDFEHAPVNSTPIHLYQPSYTFSTVNNDINDNNNNYEQKYGNLVEEINVNDNDMNDSLLNYGIAYEANNSNETDQDHNNNPN